MKKFAPWLVIAGLMLVGAGCTATTSTSVTTPPPPTQGRAVFTITDAATAITGVTAATITVNKLEVHSAAQGWVTVSSSTKQYDLLALKQTGSAALLADANLAAGTYDQLRLEISKVELTVNGQTQQATLPSGNLKIVGNLTVVAGNTSTAQLDFMVDKSLHLTGSGKYILAPVVRLLTKTDASVKIGSDAKVEINGGNTESDQTVGMDEKGDVRTDFELKDDLELDAQGTVKVLVK